MPYEDTDWSTADDTAKETSQHFYADTSGAHVADDSGAEMLMASTGLDISDENGTVTGYFHADEAQIGADTASHVKVEQSAIGMWAQWNPTYGVWQLVKVLNLYYNGSYAHFDAPASGLWLGSATGNAVLAAADGDASGEVVLRGGHMTVRDENGNQLWKGTAQQLADALNAPKVYAGSVVKTASGTNCQLWTKAAFESTFHTTNAQLCSVMVSNGEAASLSAVVSAEYWSSGSNPGWFAKWTNSVGSGGRRFNYIVVVPEDVQA